jgi:hypothetical protein
VAKKIDWQGAIVKRRRMHIRFPCVLVLVGIGLWPGPPSLAAPAEEQRLLVIEAPGNVLTKAARERLHAAIAEVAVGHGLTLASPKSLPDKLLRCDLPGCLPPIAAASGALFVLRVDAQFAKESFKLAIELWNSDEGKLLGRDRRDCPICDEQDLWGSAALLTQGLLERALREPARPAALLPAKVTSAPVAAFAPAPAPAPAAAPLAPQVQARMPHPVVAYSGFALMLAGLAAIGVGGYYIAVDGEPACNRCDWVRDTEKFGLPVAVAGGVALAGGAGLLAWSYWSGSSEIAVAPGQLRMAGRF